jgi:Zn-finger nucleic acid-binding protein
LLDQLGEGGMGTVYLAEHLHMGHQAAIKVLRPEIAIEEEMVTRLFDEARVLNRLHHPSLVQVFDCGVDDGLGPYMVMELLRGEPLSRYLKRHRRPPREKLLSVLREVAEGLSVAHRAGIVHRDLKPDNIYLIEQGGAKLLDFGVARMDISLVSRPRTAVHQTLGTPSYMAPEQVAGEPVDHRADVYALGILAFRLLTGRLPFRGETSAQVMTMQREAPIPRASELSPRLPPAVDDVLICALAKLPEERFDSCGALAEELADVLGAGEQRAEPAVQTALPRLATQPSIELPLAAGRLGRQGAPASFQSSFEAELGGLPEVEQQQLAAVDAAVDDEPLGNIHGAGQRHESHYETEPRYHLADQPLPRSCPHCAVEMFEQEFNDVDIDACPRCGGIWFDQGELEQLAADSLGGELGRLDREGAGRAPSVAGLCRPVGPTELRCPACGDPLINYVFVDDEGLAVDICGLCEGIWLDEGELARFQRGQARKLLGQLIARGRR